ncbi:MAG: cell division protein FtsA [Patescibacteria group bacterium]|jgi:cell division protein FtsA
MNKNTSSTIIAGLDIGSHKIAVCVGQEFEGMVKIIALTSIPNYGIRKGIIEDIDTVSRSITEAIRSAEAICGVPIDEAIIGINGSHITMNLSKGVIAVSRADGQIGSNDTQRVLDAAKAIALPPNREIIHVFPKRYIIDSHEDVRDPIGMTGIRLEIEAHIIGGSTPALRNIDRCLSNAEVDNMGYVFNPIASSRSVLDKRQKDLGVSAIDIGANTTGIAIFEEGDLIHAAVIPIGSAHLTNDIAIGLRIPIDMAEKIKLKYASANPKSIADLDYIDLAEFDPNESETIPRKYLSEIIEARLAELFSLIKEQLQAVDKDGMLPAGIVYTGGGSQLDGLIEASKENLRLPSQLGKPTLEFSSLVDKFDSPMYATSIGLMLWGIENLQNKKYTNLEGNLGGAVNKIKGIFKQFLP